MIKQAALNLMRRSGAFDLMRVAHRHRALILTYHRFSARDEDGKTSAANFAEQLEYLTQRYNVVPLAKIAESINRRDTASRLAAITIDDGYCDAYEIAYPLLRRYGAPATLFVPTDFIDRRVWIWTDKARFLTGQSASQKFTAEVNGRRLHIELNNAASRRGASERINAALKQLPDEIKEETIERFASALGAELPKSPPAEFGPVTWAEAREMRANGVEIGSHTLTHPVLTGIGDDRLRQELQQSKSRLEEVLKHRTEQFCYPNGDYDERVQCEVARAGYRIAVTTVRGLIKKGDDPLTLRRIHTERDLAHFAQSASGFEELKNKARRIVTT